MSEVKVNKITPTANCGTVTLGDSGDTFSLPAGVTLSNAGSITNSGTITNTGTISGGTITGTIDNQVNWDTTAKTAGFTAVAGNGYFVNTTSGAITVTLPATPTAGDLVGIKDYANTADTNNITIDRNGENIQGTANNFVISTEGLAITLIYVDGTQGWVSTGAAQANNITSPIFITATGGCISYCGDYKIHTFTGPGTFCVSQVGNGPTNPLGGPQSVDYLVVAGGAGAGGYRGGGGGAGGYRTSYPTCGGALSVSITGYPITVGGGGTASPLSNGSNSIFSSITSSGGGAGGGPGCSGTAGGSGGAGGGADTGQPGASGNTPPVSPPQGNSGGSGAGAPAYQGAGGGGGGASASGCNAPGSLSGGNGGAGSSNSITGSSVTYAGGGGGGTTIRTYPGYPATNGGPGGTGGVGGGGNGGGNNCGGRAATSGTTNTGGGGGGGGFDFTPGSIPGVGGSGGSGIVIIRYKYQ